MPDVLDSRRLEAGAAVRADLRSGKVDARLVELLASLLERHSLAISMIKSGHPMGPTSPAGRENDHFFFRAADIVGVDGVLFADDPVSPGAIALGRHLLRLEGDRRPARVMGPAAWLASLGDGDRAGFRDDEFATEIHRDHVHIGF